MTLEYGGSEDDGEDLVMAVTLKCASLVNVCKGPCGIVVEDDDDELDILVTF